jgi:hypothetical protein
MRTICNRIGLLFLLCLPLVFFAPAILRAQTAVDAAIGGTVMDSSGAVVPGATVTVRDIATDAQQTATTDSAGYYRIIHLQPGVYSVTIAARGFADYKATDVTVEVGSMTDVEGKMAVGTAAQTVQVTGEAPVINTTSPRLRGSCGRGAAQEPAGEQLPLVGLCAADAGRDERLERIRAAEFPRREHAAE